MMFVRSPIRVAPAAAFAKATDIASIPPAGLAATAAVDGALFTRI